MKDTLGIFCEPAKGLLILSTSNVKTDSRFSQTTMKSGVYRSIKDPCHLHGLISSHLSTHGCTPHFHKTLCIYSAIVTTRSCVVSEFTSLLCKFGFP